MHDQLSVKAALRRLHTESGYGLRSGLWLTAIFTGSVDRIRVNFLGVDRLPAYLKLF